MLVCLLWLLWLWLEVVGHGGELGLEEAGMHGHLRRHLWQLLPKGLLLTWEGAGHLLTEDEGVVSGLLLEVLSRRTGDGYDVQSNLAVSVARERIRTNLPV